MDNNEEKILRDTPLTEEDTSIEAADRGPEPEADTAGPEPEGPSAVKEPEDSNMAADPDAEDPCGRPRRASGGDRDGARRRNRQRRTFFLRNAG